VADEINLARVSEPFWRLDRAAPFTSLSLGASSSERAFATAPQDGSASLVTIGPLYNESTQLPVRTFPFWLLAKIGRRVGFGTW